MPTHQSFFSCIACVARSCTASLARSSAAVRCHEKQSESGSTGLYSDSSV